MSGLGAGRRGWSLRTVLAAVCVAVGLYVAGAAVWLSRLALGARDVEHRGTAVFTASITLDRLDSALDASTREVAEMVAEAGRTGQRPPAAATNQLLTRLRLTADSAWSLQALESVGPISLEGRARVGRALSLETDAVAALVRAAAALELGWLDQAGAAVAEAGQARRSAGREVNDLRGHVLADLVDRERQLAGAATRTTRTVQLWAALGVVLLLVVGAVFHTRLYRPIQALDAGLDRVARGDLGLELPVVQDDEIGRLQAHFNRMTAVLRDREEERRRRFQNLAERLGRVLDESANEIYIFDAADWNLLLASRGALRNLGYAAEQIAALTPLDFLPEFDRLRLEAVLRPLREGSQRQVLLSTLLRRADGSTYPVEMSLQLSHAEDPPVFHAVAQDVTERDRIEAERDRVFDLSVDLLATGTFKGYLTRVNAAWERTLGYTEHELLQQPFLEFVHPDDVALAKRWLRRLRDGVPIRGTAIRLRCRDGSYRWVSWNIDPPKDGNLYVAGSDITDRRRAEQRQLELQATVVRAAREWTMTFDALHDPVVIVNSRGEVVRVNDAARQLTGLPYPAIVGRLLDQLTPEHLWTNAAALAQQARTSRQTASSQVRIKGDQRTWAIEASPVLAPGAGRSAAIVIAHDVTPIVTLQDSVRKHEAMAAIGSLVAGVAHEVRNPLFSMTATLDALEARQGVRRVGQRHFTVLRSQLARLQQLMHELLEYARPRQLDLGSVWIDHVVEQALTESAQVVEENDVRIQREFQPDLPPVRADASRLVQVYVNLITNAVQHSPNGGTVRLVGRGARRDGRWWLETAVEDSGPGFQPDDLPRVFEPFYTRRRGGTGLGLALVQRIVEQHGGSVSVENRTEGGAAVNVQLPVASTDEGAALGGAIAATATPSLRHRSRREGWQCRETVS